MIAEVQSPISSGVVLVTGGTGSFGSTMVRRLLAGAVDEVRILSRDELKQHEMRSALDDPRVRFYIGDVRDYDSVDRATRGVDYVFHAAALKQVPSCEFFPIEAVKTNVIGSSNVIEASNANDVRSVVCLGTDKAAYPVNAMGMSKAMMEKVAQAFARNNPTATTTVSTVRYGNVMASRGSVIPLFISQIRAGKPLTVTDPAMTRFLMSLDEAVLLVEHAFTGARPGDLFIRKAPASTIKDLATALVELFEAGLEGPGDRHPARREALRDPGNARGARASRGPGKLFQGSRGRARPQLQRVLRGGGCRRELTGRLPLPQHRPGSTSKASSSSC